MAIEYVDFHFDVMCPWAYQGSRWIREVREHAGVDVRWRFFSLEEINRAEGKKHPWERPWSYGWSMMRIGALLRREDPALLDAWYAHGHMTSKWKSTYSIPIGSASQIGHVVSRSGRSDGADGVEVSEVSLHHLHGIDIVEQLELRSL